MKFFKPSWVNHDGNPIFSVDIHPDGTRFATGGQGPEKCGRLIIWNMAPILSKKEEHKDDVPKKLCQMDNHLACINCVRWSNHGKYLASAGDDKNLMVWQLAGRINYNHNHNHQVQSNVFESANVEQWRCIANLNGHNGDILDLGWSEHDQYLASCSVDNMIIVWDATNFPQVVTKITGHTGLVKGVSWDPAGKYLASQSDDKTIRVWRTTDWREETKVKEPFKECGGTTHVLRLDWSPDGQTLVSAHAMNHGGSVAQLIERDGWKTQRDLVGHRKAVTCVRFNSNILYQCKTKKQPPTQTENKNIGSTTNNDTSNNQTNNNNNNVNNNSTNNHNNSNSNGTASKTNTNNNKNTINPSTLTSKTVKYCCLAVGSRDRSISVWLTSQPRPLIVAHDLFESSVLDISWSKDGYRLIACSQDGTVAVMIFTPNEIGNKLTIDETQAHFQKLYGKSILTANNPNTVKTIIVEDPELIKPTSNTNTSINNNSLSDQTITNQRHREMMDHHQSSHSNSISQNGFNTGCESNTSLSGMSKGPTDRQIETLLPGGKRRITPLYIQPPLPFNSTSSITFSSSKESKTKIMIETTTSTPIQTPTPSHVPNTPVKMTAPTSVVAQTTSTPVAKKETISVSRAVINQRVLPPSKLDKASVFRIRDSNGRDLILEAGNAESSGNSDKNVNELRLLDEGNNKLWDVLIPSKINSVIATPMMAAASCIDNSLHLFNLQLGTRITPPLVLDAQVSHIAAEDQHLLVITSNATMWLWDLSQNKVICKAESIAHILPPPKIAPSTSKNINSNHSNQSSVQNNNNTNNNNEKSKSKSSTNDKQSGENNNNPSSSNNLNSQATATSDSDIEILNCSLTEHYQPLILLSNGKGFLFDFNMQSWLLISSCDSVSRWSKCRPSMSGIRRFLSDKKFVTGDNGDNTVSLKRDLPLTVLQSQHSFDVKRFRAMATKDQTEALQIKATRAYLDQQLAAAYAIKSKHEYHYWLIQSVHHHIDTGSESRLKDLCSRLMSTTSTITSPSSPSAQPQQQATTAESNTETKTGEHPDILGLCKRTLLRQVLAILSKDLRYQRLYSEYKILLEYEHNQVNNPSSSWMVDNLSI